MAMALRRFSVVLVALLALSATAEEAAEPEKAETNETTNETDEDAEPVLVTGADRMKMFIACKHTIWKEWSSSAGLEKVGGLINETIEVSRPQDNLTAEPTLNYTEAATLLAYQQMASCAQSFTVADLKQDTEGTGLGEAAADRVLGGLAAGFNLSTEEWETFDKALREEVANTEAPSILGIQVHQVPWWLQILYMIGVVALMAYVVLMVVDKLTKKEDKEKILKKKAREDKKSLKEA